MNRVNTKLIEFIVKHDSRGYILIRKGGVYEQHAHIKKLTTCNMLIRYIHNGYLPTDHYLQRSCRRLLSETEYSSLKPKKQQYFNVNKGIRK